MAVYGGTAQPAGSVTGAADVDDAALGELRFSKKSEYSITEW